MTIRTVAFALLLAAQPLAAVAQSTLSPLLSPQDLATVIETEAPLILDIRGEGAYAEGHLEGAVNAPYALFRGPAENPGQLPTEAELTEILQSLGVTVDRPVVITYQGSSDTDFGSATRVYWTLKSSGVSTLAILNGGINAWAEAGLALDETPVAPARSDITVSFSDQWMASEADVLDVVEGRASATLVDARPESFWSGRDAHAAAARPGTLPQSEYFTYSNWFRTGATTVDAEAVRALAAEAGYTAEDNLISFCNTGHWASINWFALSELAGIENVRLYPESIVGWSNAGHVMANVPGPFRRVFDQIMDAL